MTNKKNYNLIKNKIRLGYKSIQRFDYVKNMNLYLRDKKFCNKLKMEILLFILFVFLSLFSIFGYGKIFETVFIDKKKISQLD